MKRSEFLKISALSMGALFFSNSLLAKTMLNDADLDSTGEVLIIGTGYGGAVAALRFAQAGVQVKMLEMGMDWKNSGLSFNSMANPKKQSTWLRTSSIAPFMNVFSFEKFTGVLDRMDFENVKVYAGRGIGGGSLVNGGMSVTPKKEYFEEVFPNLDANLFYSKYFPRANNELGVTSIPESFYQSSEYYQFSKIGEAEAQKCGYTTVRVPNVYDFDYMQNEEQNLVPKSALNQEVIYGNNFGKKDLTKTYLKKALETGKVNIFALHKALSIKETPNGFTVEVAQINTAGNTVSTKFINTKKLILAAGSLGTTELLLKSKALGKLTQLNSEVGKHWGNNGNCMAGRNFVNTLFNPVAGSYAGQGTGAKQSTIPAAGIDNWKTTNDAFFTEIAPLPIGMETNASLYLSINRVPKLGAIHYNTSTQKIDLEWNSTHNQHMIDNSKTFLNKMIEKNGGTFANLIFNNGIGVDICYHPLGGCVLGKGTDLFGRVKGYNGLYVLDGALIPGTIGVNPYVTITAIAEYCVENIIQQDSISNSDTTLILNQVENFTVSPVPFSDFLDVKYTCQTGGLAVKIQIFNWANTLVKSQNFSTVAGQNLNKVQNIGGLWSGNYVIKCTIGSNVFTKQILK